MSKISVILPCLNVVEYIVPCLDSVVGQTYQDLEILVVDAGSTDGTLALVEKYADRDSRIRLIHSEKKSYGYQVNLGLSAASGEYIGFVDTDDMLVCDAYEVLCGELEKNGLDYVKGYARMFWEMPDRTRGEFDIANFFLEDGTLGRVVEPCRMPELVVKDHFLWLGLYTKKLLEQVRLNETPGAAFQDQGFCLQVFLNSHRAMYIDKAVYLYRQDNAASSTYNRNGMRYIRDEYGLNLRFLDGKGKPWYSCFYERFLDQCRGRFDVMALSGAFWTEAHADIMALREMAEDAVAQGYLSKETLCAEKWKCLELFLREPEELYAYDRERCVQRENALDAFWGAIGEEEVVIVGCGRWGSLLVYLLKKHGLKVAAFCDNNEKLWGQTRDNLNVLSLRDAFAQYGDAQFVIASKFHSGELERQLIEMGVSKEKIRIYTLGSSAELLR